MAKGVQVRVRTLSGLKIYWCTYLKRLSQAPSSHCGRLTLILCASTLDPRMHRCVARTKVMANLLLTYPHVLKYGCRHFVARRLAILFRVAITSNPRILLIESTKGEKCRRCWRQAYRYIFFFARSTSCRHFSSFFAELDLASVFTMRMQWTLSVPFWQRSRIRRSPLCSVASSGGVSDWAVVDFYLASFAFVLSTVQPANMRGLSRTWEGLKAFPVRSATLSRRSLWRSMTRPPPLLWRLQIHLSHMLWPLL